VSSATAAFIPGDLPLSVVVTDGVQPNPKNPRRETLSATVMSLTEVVSNPSLRDSINLNYQIETVATVSPLLKIGPGVLMVGGNQVNLPSGESKSAWAVASEFVRNSVHARGKRRLAD